MFKKPTNKYFILKLVIVIVLYNTTSFKIKSKIDNKI